jgi:hypothetical protein
MEGLSQRKTNKTLPRLITVSIPSQGSEEACTFVRVIMVSIFFLFLQFFIGFWNSSDVVVFLFSNVSEMKVLTGQYEFYQLVILVLLIDQIIKVIMSFS